jgi:hypothetical protein
MAKEFTDTIIVHGRQTHHSCLSLRPIPTEAQMSSYQRIRITSSPSPLPEAPYCLRIQTLCALAHGMAGSGAQVSASLLSVLFCFSTSASQHGLQRPLAYLVVLGRFTAVTVRPSKAQDFGYTLGSTLSARCCWEPATTTCNVSVHRLGKRLIGRILKGCG